MGKSTVLRIADAAKRAHVQTELAQPIGSSPDNSGQYQWPLRSGSPATMYVRVEAKDLAGNVGIAQTPTDQRPSSAVAQAPDDRSTIDPVRARRPRRSR
jgi:hypothetical protein